MTQSRKAPAGYERPGPDKFGIWLGWDGKDTATTGWLVLDNTGPGQEILCEVPYLLYATRIVDALRAALRTTKEGET